MYQVTVIFVQKRKSRCVKVGLNVTAIAGVILGLAIGLTMSSLTLTSTMKSSCATYHPAVDCSEENDVISVDDSDASESGGFMLIGVLTTRDFLPTRALAAHRTWAPSIDGSVLYMTSENSEPPPGIKSMKVVALTGVDDVYPPMKKAFLALQYLYDNYLDKYEWFARADDDVYIRGVELASMLRSVDSGKAQYIGQSGQGRAKDVGHLAMSETDNFCMGGTVYIMSRQTLRLVGPHISTCLTSLHSIHDDVEIGRCVRRFAGIPCTWAYEMAQLFHHLYMDTSEPVPLSSHELTTALTLHPLKNASQLHRLHVHYSTLTSRTLRHKLSTLHQTVQQLVSTINNNQPTVDSNWRENTISDVIQWQPIADNFIYSAGVNQPRQPLDNHSADALNNIVQHTIDSMNYRRREGKIVFQKLTSGYRRLVSHDHVDYVIDVTLLHVHSKKKHVTTKQRVRLRHKFDRLEFKEMQTIPVQNYKTPSRPRQLLLWLLAAIKGRDQNTSLHIIAECTHSSSVTRFMRNMAAVVLETERHVTIRIVGAFDRQQSQTIRELLEQYQANYTRHEFYLVTARLACVSYSHLRVLGTKQGLALVLTTDVLLSRDAVQRIRASVIEGSQVYYPMVLAKYYYELNGTDRQTKVLRSRLASGYWQYNYFNVLTAATSDIGQLTEQDQSRDCINYELMMERMVTSGRLNIARLPDPDLVRVYDADYCRQARSRSLPGSVELDNCLNSYAAVAGLTDLVRRFDLKIRSL